MDIDLTSYNRNTDSPRSLGAFSSNSPELHKYDQFVESTGYLDQSWPMSSSSSSRTTLGRREYFRGITTGSAFSVFGKNAAWTGRAFVDTANGEICGHGDFRRIIPQQPKAETSGEKSKLGRKHNSRVLRKQIIRAVRRGRQIHRRILQHHASALGYRSPIAFENESESVLSQTP